MNNQYVNKCSSRRPFHGPPHARRLTAVVLAAVLVFSLAAPVFAAAVRRSTPKEEVVYINLNSDGSVDKIYVVNIFELNEAGQIMDYGDYTALRNMTTSDELVFENETVRIDTTAGKLYYEGTLSRDVIPWILSFRYFLDGEESSAEALAGKSGALKITFSVRRNPLCTSAFFDNYALQAAVTLDTERCSNIAAKDATEANVGSSRQLSYMILPGSEEDYEITADVTDFEMDPISINGIHMNMVIEKGDIRDTEKLDEKVAEMKDGAQEMDEGADDLMEGAGLLRDGAESLSDSLEEAQDGIHELRDGADELADGVQELSDGTDELYDGSQQLTDGSQELTDGIQIVLDGAKELRSGAKELKDGAEELHDGTKDMKSGLSQLTAQNSTLQTMSRALYEQTLSERAAILAAEGYEVTDPSELDALMTQRQGEIAAGVIAGDPGLAQDPDALAAAVTAAATTDSVYQTLAALSYYRGVIAYTNGVASAASGASSLSGGADELADGADSLYDGADALCEGLAELMDGALELKDSTYELNDGILSLADGIVTLQDGVITLQDGVLTLKDGSVLLCDGAIELYDGTVELYDGTVELKDGTLELLDKTATMKDTILDNIVDAVNKMFGSDYQPVSFVDGRNAEVNMVQFVIRTPKIAVPEEETAEEAPVETSFWEKLMELFRKDD
ncbi:MAG: hypothetical protein ACI4VM_05850 [Anaerovoracaceae bacterium]